MIVFSAMPPDRWRHGRRARGPRPGPAPLPSEVRISLLQNRPAAPVFRDRPRPRRWRPPGPGPCPWPLPARPPRPSRSRRPAGRTCGPGPAAPPPRRLASSVTRSARSGATFTDCLAALEKACRRNGLVQGIPGRRHPQAAAGQPFLEVRGDLPVRADHEADHRRLFQRLARDDAAPQRSGEASASPSVPASRSSAMAVIACNKAACVSLTSCLRRRTSGRAPP